MTSRRSSNQLPQNRVTLAQPSPTAYQRVDGNRYDLMKAEIKNDIKIKNLQRKLDDAKTALHDNFDILEGRNEQSSVVEGYESAMSKFQTMQRIETMKRENESAFGRLSQTQSFKSQLMKDAIMHAQHEIEPYRQAKEHEWKDLLIEQRAYYQKLAEEYRHKYLQIKNDFVFLKNQQAGMVNDIKREIANQWTADMNRSDELHRVELQQYTQIASEQEQLIINLREERAYHQKQIEDQT